MRKNKGAHVLGSLIGIGLLITLIVIGKGTFSYVVALSLVSLSILVNLINLATD